MSPKRTSDTVPQDPAARPIPSLIRELRGSLWIGAAIVAAFFVFGGGWAATAPLSGAVIAGGVVSPEGSRQTVQHLEGGIIREIGVAEGESVAPGEVLIDLEPISARADAATLTSRLRGLAAREARLRAERIEAEAIAFDHKALADGTDPEIRAVTEQEMNQFETRRAHDESRGAILERRVAQVDQQIEGTERQLEGVRRQLNLIVEEIEMVEHLFDKDLASKPRLLALQRGQAELIGTEGELIAQIARMREEIDETRLHIINLGIKRVEESDAELTETQVARLEVEKELEKSMDRLARTEIVAPVGGTVMNVRFKTLGGVVRPGEALLDIVPTEGELIIDARISPRDIDAVRRGLSASVMFPSYPQRDLVRIEGEVTNVSADAFEDERTGLSYYSVKIRIDAAQMRELAPEIDMTPGLPAEVYIATGERTFLEYLLQPVLQTFERSFREG